MRAQITIFIIIGVIVLAAFALIFYAASLVGARQRSTTEYLVSQPVSDYVSSCLEQGLKDGLVLLGSQGGRIFVSQGGVHPDPFDYLVLDDVHVPFSVMPPVGSVGGFSSDPPDYPFEMFPYVGGNEVFAGFYGFNRLPPLSSVSEGRYVNGSIQDSLERFVENYVVGCADWSSFPSLEISAGVPEVSLLMSSDASAEQFLSAKMSWPLDVRGQGSLRLEDFSATVPVRLSTVYFFVNDQVDRDVADISFEPKGSGAFSVRRRDVGHDSALVFSDSLSVIDGLPFDFVLARKDRRPALWFIDASPVVYVDDNHVSVSNDDLVITSSCGSDSKLYRVPLRASDPDDDSVVFSVNKDKFASTGVRSLRVSVSDGYLEDYQDIDVEVIPCVPS